jgi:hypothetical protein
MRGSMLLRRRGTSISLESDSVRLVRQRCTSSKRSRSGRSQGHCSCSEQRFPVAWFSAIVDFELNELGASETVQ